MGSLKLALLALPHFLFFLSLTITNALNIGIQSSDSSLQLSKDCSRKCESKYCSVPPILRYGKYCGLLYSGCPGEKPCDGLDACCMRHDACVEDKDNNYLSQECSQELIDCMERFMTSGGETFEGSTCEANDVIEVIKIVMEAALFAGRVFDKP